ncbi:hypothetical protein [Oceanicoccus sagamiensis]|uniref:Uncharacterized protein n=1 Tax=Oceanicoccus sagamiensis TaxID=716816 RepID=A0A1X9NB01_9GAMM|nr:hypothetical protein [Oceanicoccus sagamiensis]ARN75218.1 hypothetical protein BST96_14495 [Oceanicoccus sagamiensis]
MKKWLIGIPAALLVLFLMAFWQMYFSARPPVMTDPATLAGDGSTINYCELPELDGSGKTAAQIPKGNTPGCGYDHFPLPILAECTEPLAEGVDDIRGLWQAVSGKVGHVERWEQCGSRQVLTGAGVIHDGGPNLNADTIGLNSNDTEGSVLFLLGDKEYCGRSSASMTWRNNVLEFNAFGWGPVVVNRYLRDDQLIWEYADGTTTVLERICQLPEEHKVPRKRGARIQLF